MGDYYFIYQNSNRQKIKIFFFSLIVFLLLGATLFAFHTTLSEAEGGEGEGAVGSIWKLVKNKIGQTTPTGMFYSGFFGASLFIPLPLELLFMRALKAGSDPWLSYFFITTGIILSQVINYLIGAKLSKLILHIVSIKKVYEMRRKLNKYGAYGIFFGNLIPFIPSELITFGLGLAKYNVYRLFTVTIIAVALKYLVIVGIFKFFF